MKLGKTINNIKNSSKSFFNLKKGDYVNFDLYKEGLSCFYICYQHDGFIKFNLNFNVNKLNSKRNSTYSFMDIYSIDIESNFTYDKVYLPKNSIILEEIEDDIWIPKLN